MIQKALQYIVGLDKASTYEIGQTVYTDKTLKAVAEPQVDCLNTNTLKSIVDYIKGETSIPARELPRIIQIENPRVVKAYSALHQNSKKRDTFLHANAMTPEMSFNTFYAAEEFNIMMQSRFIQNEDSGIILKVAGNLKDQAVQNFADDGVSQAVTIKMGVASVSDVKVPNPVILVPFRTFAEVEQPESKFIFRMKDGGRCGLFEADGGAWKLKAIENIRKYFEQELAVFIAEGTVIILA